MKSKRKIWLILFVFFGTIILLFQLNTGIEKISAKEVAITEDLFFSKEADDTPLTEPLAIHHQQEIVVDIQRKSESVAKAQIELPKGLIFNQEKSNEKNTFAQDRSIFTLTNQSLSITFPKEQDSISIALMVDKADDYQLIAKTEINSKAVQTQPLELSNENTLLKGISNIMPMAGNINLDVDISPQKATIESGQTAVFNLDLKVTGAVTTFKNAVATVVLPVGVNFTQNLSELVIAGVTPSYNSSTRTLTYQFAELVTGQVYKTLVKVIPPNGITPNNTNLTATANLQADGFSKVTDTAQVNVTAATPISVTKTYVGVKDKDATMGARPGDTVVWKIKVSINSKETGMLLAKPNSTISIPDRIFGSTTGGLEYIGTNATVAPVSSGSTWTWNYTVPTLAAQQASLAKGEDLWSVEYLVYTKISSGVADYTKLTNQVTVNATDYGNGSVSQDSNEAALVVASGGNDNTASGTVYQPNFNGPADGHGSIGGSTNPVPTVTDAAVLDFSLQYLVGNSSDVGVYGNSNKATSYYWNSEEVIRAGYKDFSQHLEIDPNLEINRIAIIRHPQALAYVTESGVPLNQIPEITLRLEINTEGNWKNIKVDTTTSNEKFIIFSRKQLGLSESDHLISTEIFYRNKDGSPINGKLCIASNHFSFNVKKGFTGKVTNHAWFSGWVQGANSAFYKYPINDDPASHIGPRSANIVSSENYTPVASTAIMFNKKDGNTVGLGDNSITATLTNDSSSQNRLANPLQGMILLPKGVQLKSNPNPNYIDAFGNKSATDSTAKGGSYSIVNSNYNNTGRQLVKVNWKDSDLLPGQKVAVELDVTIDKSAASSLELYMYGLSGDTKLAVPSSSDTSITNSVLETDSEDLNKDGNSTQSRIKAGNNYVMLRSEGIKTEKLVKGAKDSTFSKFGHTVPGGGIDYQLKLSNTTGNSISKFVLMDVLPSVGDLGITDGVSRGSVFTPKMTAALTIPSVWSNKVNVYYSTSTNPKRDDLVKNVNYPSTTQKLTNPSGATDPVWKDASSITDWSSIHSYKIELKQGETWEDNDNLTLTFTMKAPDAAAITDNNILNPATDEKQRAAWNSFGYAVEDLQAVEPERVGVVMNYAAFNVQVKKINPSGIALAGAQFRLYVVENGVEKALGTHTTDANGKITNINLAPGQYKIQEINAPTGYLLNNKKYDFTISEDGQLTFSNSDTHITDISSAQGDNIIGFTMKNDLIKYNLKLTKIDMNGTALAGAQFKLYDRSSGNDVSIGTHTIGADGTIQINNLAPREYALEEIKAPTGYKLNPKKYIFTMSEEGKIVFSNSDSYIGTVSDANSENVIGITIKNEMIKYHIKLTKTDLNGKSLAGAQFKLYDRSSGIDVSIGTHTIGSDGTIQINNLAPREYALQEVKAPDGYVVNNKKYIFTMSDDGKVIFSNSDSYIGTISEANSENVIGITVKNAKIQKLPETGSTLLVGSILISSLMLVSSGYYFSRRKN